MHGAHASLNNCWRMSEQVPIVRNDPVEIISPNVDTWRILGELQVEFPAGWVLIGGLMVYLLGLVQQPLDMAETISPKDGRLIAAVVPLVSSHDAWRFATDHSAAAAAAEILAAQGR